MKREPKEVKIKLKADDQEAVGKYSNMANVGYSPEEFTFDFIYYHPLSQFGKLLSRVVMSPAHAKRFATLLFRHVEKYEQQFGAISDHMPKKVQVDTIKH